VEYILSVAEFIKTLKSMVIFSLQRGWDLSVAQRIKNFVQKYSA